MERQILLTNGRFVNDGIEQPEHHLRLTTHRGLIQSLSYLEQVPEETASFDKVINLSGDIVGAGMIDIQLNGGFTRYFSLTPDQETLKEMTEASLQHGTPFYYVTLISSPIETIYTAIEVVREAMCHDPHILGMHLEGPFLNPKRQGAHNPKVLHSPNDSELQEIIQRGQGVIKMITIAPEMLTESQRAMLLQSGIQISIGHSDLSYEDAYQLFDQGIDIVTHLYNAMSPLTHRAPGIMGAALLHPNVYTPIILDGRHCHWAAARLAHKLKGEKLILLTDAAVLGRKMQEMAWEGLHAILTEDGFYVNPDGNLAGSAISMGEAVVNAYRHLGISEAEAMDMSNRRVALAIGSAGENLGRIAKGYRTLLTRWHQDGSNRFDVIDLEEL